ncbi:MULTISPECIES: c-type cytochrome [Salinivibrio]|uniref:Cytochrome C n=1 Tax=Salinivibrio costicola subsp. alcaliphilus TaxID=272773 RepID=A0ABX3KPI9_SALCS|nr:MULTISPECIES: cytochrome c5 family protein [Salinivibrio]NUY57030.1 cytochrome c5 family protein [Salinivibrio sp. EAGSL]OOF03288.1 cytochrome C [Salinivibrio sp. MA440]OOF33449.1 cytochrome C [Salinivibrio costicola subsp. alcaliphilus]
MSAKGKSLGRIMVASVAALLFASAAQALEVSEQEKAAIAERIAPVGDVYIDGEAPTQTAAAEPTGPRSGDQVYNTYCTACHSTGAAGAPKTGDAAAWGPRVDKGMETLAKHAINGFNAMPAKGTCMDCSDDEIVAAIEHMLDAL